MQLSEKQDETVEHAFVIPCYKDSPFLSECIESLLAQTQKSRILITTSTPSEYIKTIAAKYGIPVRINKQSSGIAGDWNFALRSCETQYCTLAHQDDIYSPQYTEKMLKAVKNTPQTLIVFCDYKELKGNTYRFWLWYLVVKRILLLPFYLKHNWQNIYIKKAILRLGCPICCPSVTYNLALLEDFKFNPEYTVNLDWNAWLELSKTKGGFSFVRKPLMQHRISGECETLAGIKENRRQNEDRIIFQRLWPKYIALVLAEIYRFCYINSKGNN